MAEKGGLKWYSFWALIKRRVRASRNQRFVGDVELPLADQHPFPSSNGKHSPVRFCASWRLAILTSLKHGLGRPVRGRFSEANVQSAVLRAAPVAFLPLPSPQSPAFRLGQSLRR